jgi:hypothetical protein
MYKSHWTALGSLGFIQFIFTYKYSARYFDQPHWAAIISVVVLLLTYFATKSSLFQRKFIQQGVVFAGLFMMVLSWIFTSTEELNVDRYSVIDSFLTAWLNGEYPYLAQSHMGNYPGPMPLYFYIIAPFWWLGESGAVNLLIPVAAWFWLKKSYVNVSRFMVYLLVLSPFWWEVLVRSNVVLNGLAIGLAAFTLSSDQKTIRKGIFSGLVMSIRTIASLSIVYEVVRSLKERQYNLVYWVKVGTMGVVVLALTFIPVIVRHSSDFLTMNPLIIESTFLIPVYYTLGFYAFAVLIGITNPFDRNVNHGLILFVPILTYLIYHIAIKGWEEGYINSSADISYFLFSVPFFIRALIPKQTTINS